MPLHLALEDREKVLAVYLDDDGSIRQIPRKHRKKLVLLDHVSRVFEPGARYEESEVNALCRSFHDDVALLRRLLVDEAFLAREAGVYWRIGGTVE
ncbi:DUF2087 domain-containing protein [Angustibacter speluncae]